MKSLVLILSLSISFILTGCLEGGIKTIGSSTGTSSDSVTHEWITGAWGGCSATACGTSGVQLRNVICRDTSTGNTVADSNCSSSGVKPATTQPCSAPACNATYAWDTGSYGSCSATACGTTGTQTRAVVCKKNDGTTAADSNCTGTKPTGSQSCSAPVCAGNAPAPLLQRGQVYMQSRLGKLFFPNGKTYTASQIQSQMTEKFNRYYTDTSWQPARVIYVSQNGSATIANNSKSTPSSVSTGVANRRAGDMIYFLKGTYDNVNIQITSGQSGTYNDPIIFYGERNSDGSLGVLLNCKPGTSSPNSTCFNMDGSFNYHAFDGFDVNGGKYGFRIVGGYQTTDHSVGNAILNSNGHNQCADPFFTGETDWFVIENNKAHHSGYCPTGNVDGHGIYISNGGDWNIVRQNEFWNNMSADFQVNADPESMCEEAGIADTADLCDGTAFNSQGEGVSEFFWIEGNYFHNGDAQGPNLTSTRNSVITKNVMAFMTKHGFTFWQESDTTSPAGTNPDLGSSYNFIAENLFINSKSHVLAFQVSSGNNEVVNNIVAAATTAGAAANSVTLVELSGNSTNAYSGNCTMGSNSFDEEVTGAWPRDSSNSTTSFSKSWFQNFNSSVSSKISDWNVTSQAPAGCPRLQFSDLRW